MQENKFLIIPRDKNFNSYKNFNSFILPLKNFSIGFDVYFEIEEINKLSEYYNIYVIVNKFLHKNIDEFKKIYNKFNKNIKFLIEDIGLTQIIDKERLIIYENHIESNYQSINYLYDLGYTNVVLNNDLTINEINEIRNKTKSTIYYFLINRNTLLYSKRKLITNYKDYYNINNSDKRYTITEEISKKVLEVNEEDGTTITNKKIFSGNKYINDLIKLDYLIINTTSMSDLEFKVTIDNYNSKSLIDILDTDYYFLENEIKYKVGDINA